MDFVINYWAVLVCGVAAMVLGYIWYGSLFRKIWSREMGFDTMNPEIREKMMKSMKSAYLLQFIGALIMAYVFAHVLIAFDAQSISAGFQGALWTWLGLMVPVKYSDKLWGGKSHKLFFIEVGYLLIQLLFFSAILVSWK